MGPTRFDDSAVRRLNVAGRYARVALAQSTLCARRTGLVVGRAALVGGRGVLTVGRAALVGGRPALRVGRTFWRLGERLAMKIPIIRAIYPAVKQVTDFVLEERAQLQSTRVVAVQPHAQGIWSIGLVTGSGLQPLSESTGGEMITVFVPSSPTAFSGYVLVVPRESVVELPLTVEEAMRLLVSGGVINPLDRPHLPEKIAPL